jgi:hypothetical protein
VAAYRNDETIARLRKMFLMLIVVGLGGGAIGLARAAISGAGPSLWSGLTLGAVGVLCVLLRRRTSEMVVETDTDGLLARNLFSTQRFGWDEIQAIEEGPNRRGFTNAVVRTVSGKERPLAAVGDQGTTSSRIVKALRRDLQSSRKS